MFVRPKKSGKYEYLQIVRSRRVNGKPRQTVIATLGRLDVLRASGDLDGLIRSCARFSEHVGVLEAHENGEADEGLKAIVGPSLVFERLWADFGLPKILSTLLETRQFQFPVERAVFLTVLHRLFASGSDRGAEYWRHACHIAGAEKLELHHLYRAMAWLGDPLPSDAQFGATPFSPRCVKDLIEEGLFERQKSLFTNLQLTFFDTTSIYFEGEGGETLGQHGFSKDQHPECKQMIVGVVMDDGGRPLCCEMWPGNTADPKTLIPVVDRMRLRFQIGAICVVADAGMISKETIAALKAAHRDCRFILGCRMRTVKEIRESALMDAGEFQEVRGPRNRAKDPAPLQVKEVRIEDRRYVVCLNPDEAARDRKDREAILSGLREKLKQGDKSLVSNTGYRRYLKTTPGTHFEIDEQKAQEEAKYDGKWVLQTDMDTSSADVALKYKDLWMVEDIFRSFKSILETRPIYHKRDETIRGHVFCSFLALVLLKELMARMEARGWSMEWERLKMDLSLLDETTVCASGKTFVIRSRPTGDAGKAIQAVGVALGPVVREKEANKP